MNFLKDRQFQKNAVLIATGATSINVVSLYKIYDYENRFDLW